MKTIGIDYGNARVGVAISDSLGTVATPRITIQVQSWKQLLRDLEALVKNEAVHRVVIGLPLHLDGGRGELAHTVERFVAKLGPRLEHLKCDVVTWDERLSSAQAERVLREGGTAPSRDKGAVDRLAAQLILQSYLDAQHPPADDDDDDEFEDEEFWPEDL